jgi:hypothetical protein
MGGFIAAWLVGEGIIVYRSVKRQKAPPGPGQLLLSSGVFVMLALLAEASPDARRLSMLLAWGFDIAALMNLWGTGGPKTATSGGWPPASTPPTVVIPTSGTPSKGSVTI